MKSKLINSISYAWKSKKVWWYTATARTKARFARTTLGGFWLGLSNLLSIASLATVYGTVFKVNDFNEYVVYLGVGFVSWIALASSISSAPQLFEINAPQLLNTNTNHIFYTLEEWAFQLQTFSQSIGMVLIGLSFFQNSLFLNLFTLGIFPLMNLLIFMYWFPVIIALIGLRYKDLYQLIPIILQLVFLISPFLYEKETLGSYSWIADLNPLYQVINSFRETLLTGDLSLKKFIPITLINIIGTLIAIKILNRSKKVLPFLI